MLNVDKKAPDVGGAIDARIIANEVLDRAKLVGYTVTNLDIQKIVYFLHGHFLTRFGRPLVQGQFEAWNHGPVHPVLYEAFRAYKDNPITAHATLFDPIQRARLELPLLFDVQAKALIEEVVRHYLDIPTFHLVELTHGPGTPWSKTVEDSKSRVNIGMKIADETIAQYFEGVVNSVGTGFEGLT